MSNIITAADLNTYTKKTLDSGLSAQVVAAVNQWIEQHTHRAWGTTKTVTERYDYKGILWLRHPDVQSITSIKLAYPGLTQTTLDPSSYYVNSYGRVSLYWGQNHGISSRNNDLMEITYVYGVTTVPDDLKLAALGIAATMYNYAASGNQNVVASQVGSYRVEYAGAVRSSSGVPNPATNTAEAFYQIIDGYVMRRA